MASRPLYYEPGSNRWPLNRSIDVRRLYLNSDTGMDNQVLEISTMHSVEYQKWELQGHIDALIKRGDLPSSNITTLGKWTSKDRDGLWDIRQDIPQDDYDKILKEFEKRKPTCFQKDNTIEDKKLTIRWALEALDLDGYRVWEQDEKDIMIQCLKSGTNYKDRLRLHCSSKGKVITDRHMSLEVHRWRDPIADNWDDDMKFCFNMYYDRFRNESDRYKSYIRRSMQKRFPHHLQLETIKPIRERVMEADNERKRTKLANLPSNPSTSMADTTQGASDNYPSSQYFQPGYYRQPQPGYYRQSQTDYSEQPQTGYSEQPQPGYAGQPQTGYNPQAAAY